MSNQNENRIPVLSFFSGGGFLDMGFEKAGFSIIWTNENNKVFARMHSEGITSWRKAQGNGIKAEIFNTKSIEDITPEEILTEAFPNGIPDAFGIIGGPPCQDFSSAGNNKGFDGERGRLTRIYFDYILKIKPSFFVFENVRNLWNNNKHKKTLSSILRRLKKAYLINEKVLNSLEFGVPQDRNRLFIIGIRKEKNEANNSEKFYFPWPSPIYVDIFTKYNWPDTNIFQNRVKAPKGVPLKLCVKDLLLKKKDEKKVPNGDEYFLPYSEKFWVIAEGNTHNRSFKRLHRYRYSPTACYGNNEVHLHPFLPRRISVREALRIQSVDDTYILPKDISLTPKFKMIGNGVPVKLAYEVALSLKNYLKNN